VSAARLERDASSIGRRGAKAQQVEHEHDDEHEHESLQGARVLE
jgi:hypothetical protein